MMPGSDASTTSRPGSRKSQASTADESRPPPHPLSVAVSFAEFTLLLGRLLPPLAEELIDDALARLLDPGEEVLGPTYRIPGGGDSVAVVPTGAEHLFPLLDAEHVPHLGRDH